MTLLYCTGYEHGLATLSGSGTGLGTTIVGSPTVQGDTKRTGDYALSCSGATYTKAITASATVTLRFSVYFSALNATSTTEMLRLSGTISSCYLYHEGTTGSNKNKLYFYSSGASNPYSSSTVTTGQWYDIDIKLDGTNKTVDWKINGTAQTQLTGFGTAGNVSLLRIGCADASNTHIIDDVVVTNSGTDYPLGDCEVIGLRPTSDGTHNNASNIMEDSAGADIGDGTGGTVNAYGYLDEKPWTSTANSDYVRQTDNGTGNYAEVNFADTTETDILGAIAVLEYAASGTSADNGGCVIIDEDTTATTLWGASGALADYSESSAFYKSVILPVPSGTWDTAAVNALKCRIGYSSDADPDPYWLAVMLEVAYRPSTNVQLTMSSAAHALTCDNITLTQAHTLAMQAAAFTEESSTPTLVELRTLTNVAACAFDHASTTPTLVELRTLAVQSDAFEHVASTPTLNELRTLATNSADLALASDAPTLNELRTLAVDAATHASESSIPTLNELRTLAVDAATHALEASSPTLSSSGAVAADSAALALACENVTLTQLHVLAMNEAAHALTSDTPTLNELRTLAMSAAVHELAASSPVLDVSESINYVLQITGEPAVA